MFLPANVGVEVPDAENCHLADPTADVECAGLLPHLEQRVVDIYEQSIQVDLIPELSTWNKQYQDFVPGKHYQGE